MLVPGQERGKIVLGQLLVVGIVELGVLPGVQSGSSCSSCQSTLVSVGRSLLLTGSQSPKVSNSHRRGVKDRKVVPKAELEKLSK